MTATLALLQASTTLRGVVAAAAERLAAAGVPTPALDARLLASAALGLPREALVAEPDRPLNDGEAARFGELVARRARREPVSRILGRREFWSLDFEVTPATLDPRPDSETLIEAALAAFPDRSRPLSVVDLGTGSGCLLLALLSEFPNASGLGVDISAEAIDVATRNAQRLGCGGRTRFIVDDWAQNVPNMFDCLVANPPYIPTNELARLAPEVGFDPRGALDGGADGCESIAAVMKSAARLLHPGGIGFVELGAGQAEKAQAIAAAVGVNILELKADLAGIPRVVVIGT